MIRHHPPCSSFHKDLAPVLNWNDIKGHQRNKEVLESALRNDRLHHALLFAGPSGVGKAALAHALAASINCIARTELTFAPACGSCSSCRKVWQGIHPDMHIVEPQGNIIKTIKIDQIREIQKASSMPPFEAREQVVLIIDAHLMGDEASNALLKTLEEPSGRMRMALMTDQPHMLLDTIRSRCQLFRFGALKREEVTEILTALLPANEALRASVQEQGGADGPILDIAAAFGEGSVGRSMAILETGILAERAELVDEIKRLRPRHPADYLQLAEQIARDKEKKELLLERLDAVKVFLRDVMRAQASKLEIDPTTLINSDMANEVMRWARALDAREVLDRIDALNEAQKLLQRRVNAQLVLERTLRKIKPAPHQSELLFAR